MMAGAALILLGTGLAEVTAAYKAEAPPEAPRPAPVDVDSPRGSAECLGDFVRNGWAGAIDPADAVVAGHFNGVYAHCMSEVTRLVGAIQAGDPHAADKLLPLVYNELRRLAAQKLAQEASAQTLQPTALVHEAYLRLVGQGGEQHWDGRGHFFAAAAEAMRRILIDNARRKRRLKHGGARQRVDFDEAQTAAELPSEDLLAVDEALTQFAAREPLKAELVKLRYFAGFSIDETAELLGISRATAKRYWVYARAWLYAALSEKK